MAENAPISEVRFRHSLSFRLLWLTLVAMLITEALVLVPALLRERRGWYEARATAARTVVLAAALPGGTAPSLAPPGSVATAPRFPQPGAQPGLDRAGRIELLRLAGVESARLQEPGRPMLSLAPVTQLTGAALIDLPAESTWLAAGRAWRALFRHDDRLVTVIAADARRPGSVLTMVLREGELSDTLRAALAATALEALAVALIGGAAVYAGLYFALVRPMRRLTRSIAAFRRDPEHAAPPGRVALFAGDEMAVAATELAAMQRDLRTALWRNARLAALGTAVAKVSHDLRGVLAPAMLTAERLQASEDGSIRRSGDMVMRTVDRATELVRRTLDFARDLPAAVPSAVELAPVIEDAAEQARAVRRDIVVTTEIPVGLTARADREQLLRVLGNLARNAAEAGAGRIGVTAAADGETLAITLTDDGPGLPAAVQRDLFRPFVTGGRAGGSGLGLAIARDLLRAQGGGITLEQTGPTGTVFRLTLPIPPEPNGEG